MSNVGALFYLTTLASHFLSTGLAYKTQQNPTNMQCITYLLDVTCVCKLKDNIYSAFFKCGN
jgi:hypothetical protein